MVVLVLVVAVLTISYASSMRAYLRQRGQIDGLSAQIASSTAHIHRLKAATREWSDPAYVEQQARQRLGWVFPGETAYQTIGPDGRPLAGTGKLSRRVEPSTKPVAWWSKEYASLESADHPARVRTVPQPATKIKPSTSSPQGSGG